MPVTETLPFAIASTVPALAVITGIVIDGVLINNFRRDFDAHMDQLLARMDQPLERFEER